MIGSLSCHKGELGHAILLAKKAAALRKIPASYRPSFARLTGACPAGVPEVRWLQAVADAERFLSAWGETADRLGWTATDLFDLHETVPLSRMDRMGLVWLLKGERVLDITESIARLEGGHAFYRRPAGTRAVR